jgi:outer membrane lipoprotein-sorting protein
MSTAIRWGLLAALMIVCSGASVGQAETPVQTPAAADAPSADDLLGRYDDLYDSSGTVASVEIVITTPKKTRTMQMRFWAKGDDRALMVVDSPARDAGTATLKVDKNLWNYLPKISRTIRVPPSMMMGSWMGSDLTNDDIVKDSSYRDDYESGPVVWSEDPAGWKVIMKAKPDVVGLWNSVEMVFEPDAYLPVMARFYDRKDRLSRTMTFDEVKNLGGRRVPTRITIIPESEEGRSTVFRYLSANFDVNVPEDTFSLSHLEQMN